MSELRRLRHFVAVAEELSFTRAARKIPLAQSALSASARSLERSLHTELFKRTGHSVALTESGEVLLADARKIFQARDEAQDAMADVEGAIRGTLRIGILQSLAFRAVTDLLIAFRVERPLIKLEVPIEPAGSRELLRAVQANRLDVAFVALPGEYPQDVHVIRLSSEPLALVMPPDHRLADQPCVAVSDLDSEVFVDYPTGWGIRRSVDATFADLKLRREVVVEVADRSTACALALCGLGIAFVIPSVVSVSEAVLHRTEPAIDFEVSVVASKSASRAATKAFVALVEDRFSSTPGLIVN
jgi:DNA-binding transcriptional LysR family regulator